MVQPSGNPIEATGTHSDNPPTLTISGGRGNRTGREIHVALRDVDGERTRLFQAWFPTDQVLDAIADADQTETVRLSEPAAQ
ncbi:MAG: hypothetical protein K0S37_3583 [Microbacterium sp.]|nr:hypothetical protein [Microbacterium sp.]